MTQQSNGNGAKFTHSILKSGPEKNSIVKITITIKRFNFVTYLII